MPYLQWKIIDSLRNLFSLFFQMKWTFYLPLKVGHQNSRPILYWISTSSTVSSDVTFYYPKVSVATDQRILIERISNSAENWVLGHCIEPQADPHMFLLDFGFGRISPSELVRLDLLFSRDTTLSHKCCEWWWEEQQLQRQYKTT